MVGGDVDFVDGNHGFFVNSVAGEGVNDLLGGGVFTKGHQSRRVAKGTNDVGHLVFGQVGLFHGASNLNTTSVGALDEHGWPGFI